MTVGSLTTRALSRPSGRSSVRGAARRGARSNSVVYLGFVLLIAYLIQDLFGLKWSWLEEVQSSGTYKAWSGVVLLLYLVLQWTLYLCRGNAYMQAAKKAYKFHKQLGYFAPIFFYAHATGFGYGHLFLLSSVFFGNSLVGLVHREFTKIKSKLFHNSWILVHVSLSFFIMFLTAYHLFIIIYYK